MVVGTAIAARAAAALCLCLVLTGPARGQGLILAGDVEGDGDVDLNDARLAGDIAIGTLDPTPQQKAAADVQTPCGVVDIRDARRIGQMATGLLPALLLDPLQLAVLPEEHVPISVALPNGQGGGSPVPLSDLGFVVQGSSGAVQLGAEQAIIELYGSGDVEATGQVLVGHRACPVLGSPAAVSYALADLEPSLLPDIMQLAADHDLALQDYQMARGELINHKGEFENKHGELAAGTAATELVFETFVFEPSFTSLQANDHPPCERIALLGGINIGCDEGFFRLRDGAGAWSFQLEQANKRLLSDSSLGDCPWLALDNANGCSRIFFYVEIELSRPTAADAEDVLTQIHSSVPGQSVDVLSVSFRDGPSPKLPTVFYLQNPPNWCGVVASSGGTIANAPLVDPNGNSGQTGCQVGFIFIQTVQTPSSVYWILQGFSQPRENFIMQTLEEVSVQLTMPRFRNLDEAETAAMRSYIGTLRTEFELAQRKQLALSQLAVLTTASTPGLGPAPSVDYVQELWEEQLDSLVASGEAQVTEQIVALVQDELQVPLEEISEQLDEINGLLSTMKSTAQLFSLLNSGDTDLSLTDRIRKVQQAFEIARNLGPGGAIVIAISPFLDFYSKALLAIADALDVIDEKRKQQVLSTGECSIIEALIPDPVRQAQWQRACEIRNLLLRIRDP